MNTHMSYSRKIRIIVSLILIITIFILASFSIMTSIQFINNNSQTTITNQEIWKLVGIYVIISIFVFIIVYIIQFFLFKQLFEPLTSINNNIKEFSKGNLQINFDDKMVSKEIYELNGSLNTITTDLKSYIDEIKFVLIGISSGNFNRIIKSEYKGNFNEIRILLNDISNKFNGIFDNLSNSSRQILDGSDEISNISHMLSNGAFEQKENIERLAYSVNMVAEKTINDANNANEVSRISNICIVEVDEQNTHMNQMLDAINDIDISSKEISKIMKTIDNIAFQTNILALNAAVEAARAGEAGKGFAIVADEVKDLANKSAFASKKTSELIQNSAQKIEKGLDIAKNTASSLSAITANVKTISSLMVKIDISANEQAVAIEDVKNFIDSITNVIELNMTHSKESSTMSNELTSQANLLNNVIELFKIVK